MVAAFGESLMVLQEPPRTRYDLKFQILGIPVRIHPLFWVISVLLGIQGTTYTLLAWITTMFSMILVHELGHALAGIKFGSRGVRIVLHGMGGLAIGATGRTRNQRIIVIAAGPVTQFLFSIPFLMVYLKTEGGSGFVYNHLNWLYPLVAAYVKATGGILAPLHPFFQELFFCMSIFTIFWVAMNLIPVFPLDGGQICSEILTGMDPVDGMAKAHKVSIVTVAVTCIGLYKIGRATHTSFVFIIILLLFLGYQNYQMLQNNNRSYW